MKSFNKKYLREIGKHDFGLYQSLVESLIYEVESIKSRYVESHTRKSKGARNKRIKLLLYIMAFVFCPVFIFILACMNAGNLLEKIISLWLTISGIGWIVLYIKNQNQVIQSPVNGKELGTKAVLIAMHYAYEVTESYFTQIEESKSESRIATILSEEDIEVITEKMNELEIDLQAFDEIMLKNNRYNQEPIILKSNAYSEKRDLSQDYALNYLQLQIREFS